LPQGYKNRKNSRATFINENISMEIKYEINIIKRTETEQGLKYINIDKYV